jgi:Tol biopolymer transport system component
MRQLVAILAVLALVAGCSATGTPASPQSGATLQAASAKPDGTASPAYTTPPVEPTHFVVAEGETWIVSQPQDTKHLGLTRPDGTGFTQIAPELPHEQLRPDWSPDGERLAFEHTPEGWGADVRDVWLSDADGSNAEPLIARYPAGLERMFWKAPAWSADGSKILMLGLDSNDALTLPGRSILAIVDVATRDVEVIGEYESANNGNLHALPRWSNDGSAIVFTLDHFRGEDYLGGALAVIERKGSGWSRPDLLTEPEEFADHADWHPTEDLIVFCTYDGSFYDTDDPSNLYTMRPDGSARTQLTHFGPGEIRATQPTWTPDGRIIFTHMTGASDETLRAAFIEADGSGLEVVEGGVNLTYSRLRPTP